MMKRLLPVATVAVLIAAGAAVSLSAAIRPAQAQETPYPVTLIMSGPSVAVQGQEITYRLSYEFTDPATIPSAWIVIRMTPGAEYLSARVISGPPGRRLFEETKSSYRWGVHAADGTEGEIEIVARIDPGSSGSIISDAYLVGTGTTSSNVVETHVFAPGTLPQAGSGGAINSGSGVALLLFALIGAALLCAGAVTRMTARD